MFDIYVQTWAGYLTVQALKNKYMFCLLFESFLEKGFVNCKTNSEFRLRSRVALVAHNSLLGFCEHKIQLTATVKWPAQVCNSTNFATEKSI